MGDDDPEDDKEDEDPYYDPFNEFGPFSEEELRIVMSDDTPDLMDLSITQTPLPPPQQAIEINETNLSQELSLSVSDFHISNEFLVPSLDDDFTFFWDMFESVPNDDLNINVNDNDNNVVENARLEESNQVIGPNFETGGASTTPVTVIPETTEGILSCTCCNPLQQFVHTNGEGTRRLNIYGGTEFFCHAIVEIHEFGSNELSHRTIHLKGLRIEDVRKFIDDYCSWKEECGFSLMESNAYSINDQPIPPFVDVPLSLAMPSEALDVPLSVAMHIEALDVPLSLAMPSEALDVPLSVAMHSEALDVPLSLAMPSEALDVVPQNVGLREGHKKKKVKERRQTPLAAQRERTGKLTLRDMSKFFHLPMKVAAQQMNVCPTVVKRVCRKGGCFRWPYRKINSVEKKIAALKNVLSMEEDAEVRALVEKETERLQKIISDICSKALQNFQ